LLDEPKLGRFREGVTQPFVAKVRADLLQADVGAVKRLARLLRSADVVQQLAQRDFRLPILNGVSERDGQVERRSKTSFGAIPVFLGTRDLASQTPSFDEVLARPRTSREIEARGTVVARGTEIPALPRQMAKACEHPD
jgi:hypothetical protein